MFKFMETSGGAQPAGGDSLVQDSEDVVGNSFPYDPQVCLSACVCVCVCARTQAWVTLMMVKLQFLTFSSFRLAQHL